MQLDTLAQDERAACIHLLEYEISRALIGFTHYFAEIYTADGIASRLVIVFLNQFSITPGPLLVSFRENGIDELCLKRLIIPKICNLQTNISVHV